MRIDSVRWACGVVGEPVHKVLLHRNRKTRPSLLWGPKPMLFGIQYMLLGGGMTRDDLMTLAMQGMRDNSKEPLVAAVRESEWVPYMRRFRINITNLYPNNRENRYRWWLAERHHDLVMQAAEKEPEEFKRIALSIYDEEYAIERKKHFIGRHIDEQHSPERTHGKGPDRTHENQGNDS